MRRPRRSAQRVLFLGATVSGIQPDAAKTAAGDSRSAAISAPQTAAATLLERRDAVLQAWRSALPPALLGVDGPADALLEDLLEGLADRQSLEHAARAFGVAAVARGVGVGTLAGALGDLFAVASTLLGRQPAEWDHSLLTLRVRTLEHALEAHASASASAIDSAHRSQVLSSLQRRILALSASVGPHTRLDEFTQSLVRTACEVGDAAAGVLFLYDGADTTFYAEARLGIGEDEWRDILALPVPKRVYDRMVVDEQHLDTPLVIGAHSPLLDDAEVASCFAPLLRPARGPGDGSLSPAGSAVRMMILALDVPGRGTVGFCALRDTQNAEDPGAAVRQALQMLGAHGAIFIENITLYRMQMESAAISSALLQVAGVVGTADIDMLVQRTLSVLPRLFGGETAALLYLDRKRGQLRMLEARGDDSALTAITEVMVTAARMEQLDAVLHASAASAIEEGDIGHLLPPGLVQARGIRSALVMPLGLSTRQGDALVVFWMASAHRFRGLDLEVARGASELLGVALTNAQLFAEATDRAEQLSALYRTGQMMSSSLDLEHLLGTITAAAVALTRSKICVIYLIDPRAGVLEYVAGTGLSDPSAVRASVQPGEGFLGRCALLGKPLLVDDLQADQVPPPPEAAIDPELHAALFLPLSAGGEVIGVLATAAQMPSYYLAEHQQILQAFAHQAAVAIERTRLYEAEQRRRELAEVQQTMMHTLGSSLEMRDVLLQILGFCRELVGYSIAAIHIFEAGHVELGLQMDTSGVASEVVSHSPFVFNEPLYSQLRDATAAVVVSDVRREPLWRSSAIAPAAGSWIGAPLLADADFLVLLDLFSVQQGTYTQEDAESIEQFAHQIAFAIRNARIYAREREAKLRLEELDQLRADFVSTVSHELRTPLTGIKGFTETLLNYWTRLDDERKHHYLERIFSASKRLQRLVQDLLFVSKVEGGNLPLSVRKVELPDLLDSAEMEITQKYRGQEIALEIPPDLPLVLADADRTQQVLVNLMDNAVKYSSEGSPITVRCIVLPDVLRLSVIDRGPGIRPQDLSRLFTRFGKIDQVIRAGHVGTGLGLFISKQLVEQMGGVIEVESVPGQGSTFSFTLPRADE